MGGSLLATLNSEKERFVITKPEWEDQQVDRYGEVFLKYEGVTLEDSEIELKAFTQRKFNQETPESKFEEKKKEEIPKFKIDGGSHGF